MIKKKENKTEIERMKKITILILLVSLSSYLSVLYPDGQAKSLYSKQQNDSPDEYFLGQNYPNPFNPFTTIIYSLKKPADVKIEVHNLIGQKIKTLENSFKSPGNYSVVWDATDEVGNPVGSGIYFYRLEAGEKSFQKKMILIR